MPCAIALWSGSLVERHTQVEIVALFGLSLRPFRSCSASPHPSTFHFAHNPMRPPTGYSDVNASVVGGYISHHPRMISQARARLLPCEHADCT